MCVSVYVYVLLVFCVYLNITHIYIQCTYCALFRRCDDGFVENTKISECACCGLCLYDCLLACLCNVLFVCVDTICVKDEALFVPVQLFCQMLDSFSSPFAN